MKAFHFLIALVQCPHWVTAMLLGLSCVVEMSSVRHGFCVQLGTFLNFFVHFWSKQNG